MARGKGSKIIKREDAFQVTEGKGKWNGNEEGKGEGRL